MNSITIGVCLLLTIIGFIISRWSNKCQEKMNDTMEELKEIGNPNKE